jgi:hypothetical protein
MQQKAMKDNTVIVVVVVWLGQPDKEQRIGPMEIEEQMNWI